MGKDHLDDLQLVEVDGPTACGSLLESFGTTLKRNDGDDGGP